jgi:hypothetical protein
MRKRGYLVGLGLFVGLIIVVVATHGFDGRLERWLLRLHGIH